MQLSRFYRIVNWIRIKELYILGFAAVFALFLGIIGFNSTESNSSLTNIYLAFQLFTLESGALKGTIPLSLHIARWLAPATLAYAAIKAIFTVLNEDLRFLKLAGFRNHVIICGMGEKGAILAQSFLSRGERVVALDSDRSNENSALLRAAGVFTIRANAINADVLRKSRLTRAKYLVAVTGDNFTNIEVLRLAHQIREKDPSNSMLIGYAHINDLNLKNIIQDTDLIKITFRNYDARIFNIFENYARLITRKYPPDIFFPVRDEKMPPIHVLVLGFDQSGEALVTQLSRIAHYYNGRKLELTILTPKPEASVEFSARFPRISDLINIHFFHSNITTLDAETLETIQKQCPVSLVYFCIEDENQQLKLLAHVRALFGTQDVKMVVNFATFTPVSKTIREDKRIFIDDFLTQACSAEIVVDEMLDKFARAIHENFLISARKEYHEKVTEAQRMGEPAPVRRSSMVEWEELSEEYKDSNRSQAEHIYVKLRAIGCKTCDMDSTEPTYEFTEEEIYKLAQMEHRRWVADRILSGWRLGGERDESLKFNPDLVTWERLPQSTKDYDFQAIKNISGLLKLVDLKICKTKKE